MNRVRWTEHSVEILDGDIVVSHLPLRPGPTDSLFDVMAALACIAGPEGCDRIDLLGFAAGGVVAPLRALGFEGTVVGIDLDPAGMKIFRRASEGWGGSVRLERTDAIGWLEAEPPGLSVVIDDLSIPGGVDVLKPYESFEVVPRLAAERLGEGGFFLSNLLPHETAPWEAVLASVASPFADAREVRFEDWENRLVLGAQSLPSSDAIARRVREALVEMGSDHVERFTVHDPQW